MVDKEKVLHFHRKAQGKIEIIPKVMLDTENDLATYYTPGVAYVCEEIKSDPHKVYDYTSKSNTIAIVSDGTRILGLGNIGPQAGLPVIEGKAILFKRFGGVDAIPIMLGTTNEDEIVKIVKEISPAFGGINIEDIESPKSFRILKRLSRELDIPVFHDDSQGTGIVALAGLLNAMKLAGKKKDKIKIVVNGAGSAGIGITMQLANFGFKDITVVDSDGAIYEGREGDMNEYKKEVARITNAERRSGGLGDVAKGADVLIGASEGGAFSSDIIALMSDKPIVFALANPIPEIGYEEAKAAGAYIAATGASGKPNQINNLIAFPAVMRGLLDSRARRITYRMLHNASVAMAKSVGKGLSTECIVPNMLDQRFALKYVPKIAASVAEAAVREGEARHNISYDEARDRAAALIRRYRGIERKAKRYMVEAV